MVLCRNEAKHNLKKYLVEFALQSVRFSTVRLGLISFAKVTPTSEDRIVGVQHSILFYLNLLHYCFVFLVFSLCNSLK